MSRYNQILDEFTHLAVSRQRRYQLRAERDKLCRICGLPALVGIKLCAHHHEVHLRSCRKEDSPLNASVNPAALI